MANRLKMAKIHSIQTLRARGWSQRRIARALDVDRETVARYVRAAEGPQNQPNPPTGSEGPRDPTPGGQNQPNPPLGSTGPVSRCEPFRERIRAAGPCEPWASKNLRRAWAQQATSATSPPAQMRL